jgi:hypothetical protein
LKNWYAIDGSWKVCFQAPSISCGAAGAASGTPIRSASSVLGAFAAATSGPSAMPRTMPEPVSSRRNVARGDQPRGSIRAVVEKMAALGATRRCPVRR